MRLDAAGLDAFYDTPLGHAAKRILGHRIRARWRSVEGITVAGVGFACPYLSAYNGKAGAVVAMMPAPQGALVWPTPGPVKSVLVEETALPFPDNSVDRLLVVHALEVTERPEAAIREFWRVLAPEGRIIVVVPNRRGLWARFDSTPFGFGRPFSRRQLDLMLRDGFLTPVFHAYALQVPPLNNGLTLRWAVTWERLGAKVSPMLGAVIVVEARKEVSRPIGKAARTAVAATAPARATHALAHRGPVRHTS